MVFDHNSRHGMCHDQPYDVLVHERTCRFWEDIGFSDLIPNIVLSFFLSQPCVYLGAH